MWRSGGKDSLPSPLEGIRVVENGVHLAGPYCGRLLAELGAEVVKVEPPTGEANRRSPPLVKGVSLLYLYYNGGKKSLVLDLKQARGAKAFKDLIARSDIFLCNYRPGAMEKLGLGYEDLKKVNPRIIYISVTGFGCSGPYSNLAGYDPLAQAVSGLMDANGCEDGLPKVNAMSLDYATSMIATSAALAALYYREKTGKGQFIDMSLHDTGVVFSVPWMGFYISGMKYRHGNRSQVFAPYNMYKARDGFVMVAIGEDNRWARFLDLIGRRDLIGDPRFSTVEERVKHYDDIDELVSSWTSARTVEEVRAGVEEAGGASAPVKTLGDAQTDPNAIARRMLVEVDHPVVGRLKVAGSGYKMSETPGLELGRAPDLGEHSDSVLTGILGYSAAEVEDLVKSGVTSRSKSPVKSP